MRLIDANNLEELCGIMADKCWSESVWEQFRSVVADVPTVDAVPVVRCKDCKYWNPYKSHHYKGHFCDVVTLFVQENEYCAWGKRKGGADDEAD